MQFFFVLDAISKLKNVYVKKATDYQSIYANLPLETVSYEYCVFLLLDTQ
jgi:hypothetical protein